MTATQTLAQFSQSHNSLVPRHGVVTFSGYGIRVQVDRGHLLLRMGLALIDTDIVFLASDTV